MQTSKSNQLKHAVGQLLAQKQKAPHRTAKHRKKSLLFSVVQHQQHMPRLPSALRVHPKKYIHKLLLKLVLQQHSQLLPALLVLQQHGQLLPILPVQRQRNQLPRTLLDPQQHNQLLPALLVLQRELQRLIVREQIQPNARSQGNVVAELLHQYNVKLAMLPHNVRLLPVAQPRDPVHGQVALHLAHIDQVDAGLARGDMLQAHQCVNSLNDAYQ